LKAKRIRANCLLLPQLRVGLLVLIMLNLPCRSLGQELPKTVPDGTEGDVLKAADSSKTEKLPWNMFDTSFTTIKLGAGFLYEYAGYTQDATAKRQMDSIGTPLKYDFDVRDFRILIGGQLKTKRTITWKAGFMYDGDAKSWYVRESGVMIATPEIWGSIFIGRTKEGFSLSKVMNGYSGESLERHMNIDAVPILGDGIKWLGYLPKPGIVWNMGIFADWLSKDQGFSTYSWQFITRAAWLPIHSEEKQTTLHIGGNFRIGQPEDNKIRLKSKPESNTAPIFIDTGTFSSNQGTFVGWEIYYNKGPWLFGTEYNWEMFNSKEKNDPVFHGGEVMMSYIFTGASRPYTPTSGIYTFIPVKKSVFEGGLGEIEAALRYSTNELNGGLIEGGSFWRITPTVNWYLSKNFRFEFAYGYGILDRYSLKGATQFFQSRIQILL
jgi:phosphate-selective porin OprO/OprP